MNLKCAAKHFCCLPKQDVEIEGGRYRHTCLHCGLGLHDGAYGEDIPGLIKSKQINLSSLSKDTTDKWANMDRYHGQLVCQFCWKTDAELRKVTDAITETIVDAVAETATAANVPRLHLMPNTDADPSRC